MTKRHKHFKPPFDIDLVARKLRTPHSRKIKSGTPYRGIIASKIVRENVDGRLVDREYALHATKGYRAIRQ